MNLLKIACFRPTILTSEIPPDLIKMPDIDLTPKNVKIRFKKTMQGLPNNP